MKLKAYQVAEIVSGDVEGNDQVLIDSLAKIENGKEGSLSFSGNPKYNKFLISSKSSIVLVEDNFVSDQNLNKTLIRVKDPNEAFSKLLNLFGNQSSNKVGVDKLSSVDNSVSIGKNVYIGAFSICEKDSHIGENSKIYSQVYIGENVSIGTNTIIFPGVKIYGNSVIGNNCIIHSGTVIGSDGFGFNLDKNGNQLKVIHNGNVIIEDNVEIGANCTVDKATLGSTLIKEGVKIDNLVQVAHNVEIGESTVIAACVGIAGSTTIGKNCMIGGQAGISGHLKIGDRVMVQAQSGVMKSIPSDTTIMGMPAFNYLDYNKSYVHFKNLPKIMSKLNDLFKKTT